MAGIAEDCELVTLCCGDKDEGHCLFARYYQLLLACLLQDKLQTQQTHSRGARKSGWSVQRCYFIAGPLDEAAEIIKSVSYI